MTEHDIHKLLAEGNFPDAYDHADLVETHISWVIVCDHYVYKIKKPIHYSFLDFSTPEQRKYYCEREVDLNRRLAKDMYLDVQPIKKGGDGFVMGGQNGTTVDYAVRMRKIDRSRQMDVLLKNHAVSEEDIRRVAVQIAKFHKEADVIHEKDVLDIRQQFNALAAECGNLPPHLKDKVALAVEKSDRFVKRHAGLLEARLRAGLFRDVHGDLHLRNIFLLPEPLIFDCIEFNDDYRQIDVLNEVAFLCMDLDAAGREDLSAHLIGCYNELFPVMQTDEEKQLFRYYKSYRANVRAKVNCLRAKDACEAQRAHVLQEAEKYLRLMEGYGV